MDEVRKTPRRKEWRRVERGEAAVWEYEGSLARPRDRRREGGAQPNNEEYVVQLKEGKAPSRRSSR